MKGSRSTRSPAPRVPEAGNDRPDTLAWKPEPFWANMTMIRKRKPSEAGDRDVTRTLCRTQEAIKMIRRAGAAYVVWSEVVDK